MTDSDATTAAAAGPTAERKRLLPLLLALILAGGLIPPIAYWLVFGRRSVTPAEAKAILTAPNGNAVLVDISRDEEFSEVHIRGAENWPYEEIRSLTSLDQIPQALKGKRLVLICPTGRSSALAGRRLREWGAADAVHVRGGVQGWIADAQNLSGGPLDQFVRRGSVTDPPFRQAPLFEQAVAVASGYVVKPLYGLISFVLALVLWKRRRPELVALKWAMICFFLGEQACAVNYIFFDDQSYLAEYLHSFGMLLCFGFATYAIFEGMDRWIIKFSPADDKCAALNLCRRCYKYASVPCGLRRTFLLIVPAMIVLAFMPLVAEAKGPSYNTSIFGSFYNYSHPAAYQMFEIRYCPAVAIVLMAASLLVLLIRKEQGVGLAKVLFAAGMGPLGFGLLRLVIFTPYRDNLVWFVFWEEVTELLFVVGVAYVLRVFREGLFRRPNMQPAKPQAATGDAQTPAD